MWAHVLAAFVLAVLPHASGAGEREFEIGLHELAPGQYHLVPESLSVERGETVRLRVVNPEGNAEAHNLVICGDAECGQKWGFTPDIPPGGSANVTFTADRATGPVGFEYYCQVFGHKESGLGMKGRMVVSGEAVAEKATSGAGLAALATAVAVASIIRRR